MGTLFHLSEILKFAIEKEIESAELYQRLVNEAANAELKTLFMKLVQQEQGHKKFYENMINAADKWSSTQDTEEYAGYMRELIASSRTVAAPLNFSNLRLVFDYAIAREKDSILFYAGLINFLPTTDREGIYTIIQEEMHHVTILTERKKLLH